MGHWNFIHFMCFIYLPLILLLPETCTASFQHIGQIGLDKDEFKGSPMDFIDNNGIFLKSSNSKFGFGFTPTKDDVTLFLLNIIYMDSTKAIWSANNFFLVKQSDDFNFDKDGNAYLESGGNVVWSTNTSNKGVSSMELQDSGNLVLLRDDKKVIWESFSHPTDTLLSNQDFKEGMKLVSEVNSNNVSYFLEIKNGDMILYAGYETPQPYWSMGKETRKNIDKDGGKVAKATLDANSWRFLDQSDVFLGQFIFSLDTNVNNTWIAVLDNEGFITFSNLQKGGSSIQSATKIPNGFCNTPDPCNPYLICSGKNNCQCPLSLNSRLSSEDCTTGITTSPCDSTLVSIGDGIGYFAIDFVTPNERKIDLNSCKSFCANNCSCLAVFFKNSSGDCFLFDKVGSLRKSDDDSGIVSFVKVSTNGGSDATTDGSENSKKHVFPVVVIIAIFTLFVIGGLVYGGFRFYHKKKEVPGSPHENSDEDNFFENISGMPIRFSYKDLQSATNNFEVKLGQGGFGSVYQGTLPDGSQIAVKKLESIGQGKKEFRAEVSIIASIHHQHLVKLRGFCTEGTHRLLAYEFMANGSLEKWIFKSKKENFMLDWETRYNIALGTAKGLAYLHEDCDVKIVHCDIKPENVLLDENYHAKVSDFGLAKLMTREQSHVFTTLRGTRGYLAPEWITNYAISEKSDVYSYGMVLLEIIGGRKNFDPSESSEKSHFPSYAFKMMEEGKLKDILDSNIKFDEHDEKVTMAIKVALWCIQEDMSQRPPMSKVVQMLEGNCVVPTPPTSSQLGGRLYSSFFKSISEEGTSSGPSDCNSDAYISAVRLSGPR